MDFYQSPNIAHPDCCARLSICFPIPLKLKGEDVYEQNDCLHWKYLWPHWWWVLKLEWSFKVDCVLNCRAFYTQSKKKEKKNQQQQPCLGFQRKNHVIFFKMYKVKLPWIVLIRLWCTFCNVPNIIEVFHVCCQRISGQLLANKLLDLSMAICHQLIQMESMLGGQELHRSPQTFQFTCVAIPHFIARLKRDEWIYKFAVTSPTPPHMGQTSCNEIVRR